MTTVAFKDGILAADTQGTQGDMIFGHVPKIMANEKYVVSCAGMYGHMDAFLKNLIDGTEKEYKDTSFMFYDLKARMLFKSEMGLPNRFQVLTPFTAIGSGGCIAMGAMGNGASAIEAIKIAIDLDIWTSGRIVAFDCLKNKWIKRF